MKANTFIRSFYIFQFFFDFIFIYAVEKLFFLNKGLDLTQIGLLLFSWSIMTLLLEVPTGIIADHWSRRKMLILCGIFFSLCYGIWIFSNSFWIFLLGFLLRTLGIGIAVAFGGFFSEFSYSFTLAASAISILIVSIIAFMWPEIKPLTPTGEENYWDFLKNSIKTIKNNSSLIKIVLFSAVVMSIFANLEEYNDVYLQFLGFPNRYIGLIFTVATIGQSIASMYAHKFKHYAWTTLNSIALIGFIILLLASFIKLPIMATGILLLGILLELSGVLNQGIIQTVVLFYFCFMYCTLFYISYSSKITTPD